MAKIEDANAAEVIRLAGAVETVLAEAYGATHEEIARGAMPVRYDTGHVLGALCWVMASHIVQCGEFPTLKDRKRAAKEMERRIMISCEAVDQMVVAAEAQIVFN